MFSLNINVQIESDLRITSYNVCYTKLLRVIGFVALLYLNEPKGHMAEVNEDGTVELIKVS